MGDSAEEPGTFSSIAGIVCHSPNVSKKRERRQLVQQEKMELLGLYWKVENGS